MRRGRPPRAPCGAPPGSFLLIIIILIILIIVGFITGLGTAWCLQ